MKARDIADLVGGELVGDGDVEIASVADIAAASSSQIAFLEKAELSPATGASCLIVPRTFGRDSGTAPSLILVDSPKLAFARTAEILHPRKEHQPGIHPSAAVASTAKIGRNVFAGRSEEHTSELQSQSNL